MAEKTVTFINNSQNPQRMKNAKGDILTIYYEEDFRAMVAGKALARPTGNYVAYLDDKTKTVFIFVKDIVEDAPAPLQ